MLQKIKEFIFGKKRTPISLPYAFIRYTESAQLNNVKDNQNKVIEVYDSNKYGVIEIKKLRYHPIKVSQLKRRGVPVYDRTKEDSEFEVISVQDVGAISYKA